MLVKNFSVLSSARARTNVILAGKGGSRGRIRVRLEVLLVLVLVVDANIL